MVREGPAAPGRTEEEYQGLRYDLASALEQAGETERALALFTELYGQDAYVPRRGGQAALSRRRSVIGHPPPLSAAVAPVLSILSSLVVGIVLVIAPWLPSSGTRTGSCRSAPSLRGPLLSAFTRGAVTGLGLVNVLLALADVGRHCVAPARHD